MMSSSRFLASSARPKKVLTSPFAQTLDQIAPSWPPFNPQSQKYMALGELQLQEKVASSLEAMHIRVFRYFLELSVSHCHKKTCLLILGS